MSAHERATFTTFYHWTLRVDSYSCSYSPSIRQPDQRAVLIRFWERHGLGLMLTAQVILKELRWNLDISY